MADTNDASTNAEPSMEEILASIRRIIADEKDPAEGAVAADSAEDVIELTQVVQEDGSIGEVNGSKSKAAPEEYAPPPPPPPPPPMPAPTPEPVHEPEPPAMPDPVPSVEESLVSPGPASVAASTLSALAHTLEAGKKSDEGHGSSLLGHGMRTLEDMVMELMKPLLKTWLDENLPPIVERVVQKEVERIARNIQE